MTTEKLVVGPLRGAIEQLAEDILVQRFETYQSRDIAKQDMVELMLEALASLPSSPQPRNRQYLEDLRHDLRDESFAFEYLLACAQESTEALRIGVRDVLAAASPVQGLQALTVGNVAGVLFNNGVGLTAVVAQKVAAELNAIAAGQRAEGAEAGVERYPGGRQSVAETIEDGFGSVWSKRCPVCEQLTMEVVRPGKAQCWANHKPLTQTDEYCSICREPMNLVYGENLFERKPFQRQNIWECHNDACPNAPTPSPSDAVAGNEARAEVVEKTPEISAPPVAEKTELDQAGRGEGGVWIACTDSTPRDGEIVFVWDKGWHSSYIAQFTEEGWESGDDHEEPETQSDITHWMRYPRQPAPRPTQAVAENEANAEVVEKQTAAALGSGQELREKIAVTLWELRSPAAIRDWATTAPWIKDYHYGQADAVIAALALPLAPKVPARCHGTFGPQKFQCVLLEGHSGVCELKEKA